MTGVALGTLAEVVRSKNAGPTQLTLDIFFRDKVGYYRAVACQTLSPSAIGTLYQTDARSVRRYLLPNLLAIKFSLPRAICAGNPGDGDVYGAQQHVPLLRVLV